MQSMEAQVQSYMWADLIKTLIYLYLVIFEINIRVAEIRP